MGTRAYWFSHPYRWRSQDTYTREWSGWTYAATLADVRQDFAEVCEFMPVGEVQRLQHRSGETTVTWTRPMVAAGGAVRIR